MHCKESPLNLQKNLLVALLLADFAVNLKFFYYNECFEILSIPIFRLAGAHANIIFIVSNKMLSVAFHS